MKRQTLRIASYAPRKMADLDGSGYGAALGSLGFETRAREIPERLGTPPKATAVRFGDRHELDYKKNEDWFADNGWTAVDVGDQELVAWMIDWLTDVASVGRDPRVAIDISSMSRLRIAAVIQALMSLPPEVRLTADVLYTPPKHFRRDPKEEPQVFEIAPVSGYFAGWWTSLEQPLVAILGIGSELEIAASAIDALEPERAAVFVPNRDDRRYAQAVESANAALLRMRDSNIEVYRVADPFACFERIEGLVTRMQVDSRVALVPLGPKIFAVCAMLAAALHPNATQVIRVSSGPRGRASNRISGGRVCGLTVIVPDTSGREDPPLVAAE